MINSLLKLNKHFKYKFTALGLFTFAFGVVFRFISAFKSVNQRTLSILMTTLVLSAFLTACSGGGGGSDAPAPTAPTFSVSSSNISIDEDFATSQLVASVSNATSITVSQSNTGVVTVTTSNAQVDVSSIANANGRTTLTISAANGTLIATTQVTVIVNAVNDTPTLAVSSNNISTVGGFSPITINTTASDIEDANLTFTVAESTTGVVTVVTSTNATTLSETPGGSGQTTLTIIAVDSSGSTVTQTIVVSVFNRAPILTAFTTFISLQEDFTTLLAFSITAADLDGDTITLSVSSTTRLVDAAISTLTNGVSGITLSAIANANGTTTLTVQATAAGQSVSTNVVVVVAPVNDPPTIIVSSNSISTVGGFSPITINTTASDIEDGTLPFTVSDSNPGVVTVTTSANGITLNAISGVSSQTILTVRTADRAGTTVTRTISVNVINTTPELMVSTNVINLQEDFSASVMFGITATDLDGDTLTLSLSSTTRLVDAAISTLTMSTITLSAIANANGTTTLTIQAMDVIGQSVSRDVVVVVTSVNDTPTLTIPNANLVVAEDFSGHSTIATALDIDGDPLTFSVSESTTGLVTVSTSASGATISNRPHANGVTTLTITVGDGSLSSTAQVVVTVTAFNDPPVLTIPTATLTRLEDFAGGITVATASDVDGNPLTFSVIESTTGVIRVTVSTSDVGISSLGHANGITTLSISVSDGRTASSTAQVVVTVTAVNDPPVLSVSTTALTVLEDFATTEVITVTSSDVDSNTLTLTVSESSTGVVTVTTSASGVQVVSILNANGRTTLTIRVTDGDGLFDTTDVLVVVNDVDDSPVLTISTNLILVDEDFSSPVVIRTTATDADGDALIVSISSSSRLVDAVLSTPVNGMSIITNMITLSAMTDLNGTTTLTVQAIDAGGTATTEQIVVVVNAVDDPIPFTLSTTAVSLSVPGSQLDRIINAISISNPENKTLRAQIQVTTSGDNVFSTNPAPIVSFTTNALTAVTTLTSTTPTAQLYFTIVPNQTGTATLTVHLTNLDDSSTSQQTMMVSVNSSNVPPTIVAANSSITNLVVHGSRLYANDTMASGIGISRFLTTARTLGGHLMNVNSVEEFSFMRSAASGLIIGEAWLGMVLPQQRFPGELSWITHDSTIGYGYARTNGAANLTVYPGHFNLTWFPDFDLGLRANRYGRSTTVANWTIFATGNGGVFFLIDDGGDGLLDNGNFRSERNVIYEFPQGLLTTSTNPTSIVVVTSATVRLTGFDLNGDTISTNDWSITDLNGGSAIFNNDSQSSGVQTVTMIYTAPANFVGQTTVVVTLQVNGLSTTHAISLIVDEPPTIALSTRHITLAEDFGTFDIGTTVTDRLMSTSLPFSVSASPSGILTITTSANNIQLSAVSNAHGTTTLTVQAMDARGQSSFANVVVVVAPVNDPPILAVSANALTLTEDFATTEVITVTRSDIDSSILTLTVSESATGVVNVSTSSTGVQVVSIADANGQTTLTITVGDGTTSVSTQILVTVNAVNDPPVLTASTITLALLEDFATTEVITITRSDVDGDTLTLTVSESTTGVVSVSTSSTGIQVVSIADVNGQTTLTITVGDGTASVSTQVLVTVNAVNDPPVLSASPDTLTLNEDFATTEVITVTRSDIDSSTLTLTVSESATGVVNVSTSSAGIQVISIGDANGQTTLTITVSDGTASASTQVLVTVNAVNDTPTLTVSSNSISTVGGFLPIIINTTASDIEDINISFTVLDANTGVVTVTTSTNAIVLNTISGASGQTTLTATVVDSSGATVTEIITVSVSIRPSVATPVVTVSTNLISVQEDFRTPVIIQTTATDADGDTITVSVSASMPFVNAVISTPVNGQSTISNSITLTAIADANGTATLTVLATDSGGQSNTTEIVVVVSPVEDTPTLTIPSTTLTVAEDFASTLTIATANDVDGDTLLISVVESTTGIITVTTTALEVSVSSILNANGQTTLTIIVNDDTQDTTAQVVVTVTPVNDPPALTIPTTTLTVMEDFAGGITVATANDVDGNPLTFSVIESTTGVIRVTTSTSDVRISSRGDVNGVTTLSIIVSDGTASLTAQVVVTVTAVNDPPVLTVSTSALTLDEDFGTALIATTRTDIDSNTLTLTVAESATGVVTVTTSASGVQIVSILNTNGRTTLTVRVTDDDGLFNTTDVLVVVNEINDPPVLTVSTNALTLDEDFGTILIATTRSDVDGDTLTLTVAESATGVITVTTLVSGVSVSNILNANGQTTLTITLSDGRLSTTAQVMVDVTAVNDPPVLTVSTTTLTLVEDFASTLTIATVIDVDGDALNITVIESSTGVVTVTTSASGVQVASILSANGRTTLTVRVTDGDGLFDTTDVLVVVNDVDDSPGLTVSTNLILVDEDFSSPVVIRTTATDADGDGLIVSISSSSRLVDAVLSTPVNGMSIITNMITLTAITDLNGTTTLTVQVIDSGGIATTEQIVMVVNAVDDPIPFTLSTSAVSLSVHDSRLDRIVNAISINNSGNQTLRAQLQVTSSGDPIFSANPTPVVSFTTNALTTVTTLTSTTPTAQLYFTIVPNQTGTATLTVHLANLTNTGVSQQTLVVSVNSPNVPPEIVAASPSLTNLVVHGGRLYANDVSSSNMGISRFLTIASALGGHLMNINSVEEYSFVRSAASGLIFQEAWLGMVLPNRFFPGELSWMTHNSTIGYGYVTRTGVANLTIYPGHFNLTWFPDFDLGLRANRTGSTATVSNWAVHATAVDVFFLVDDGGDVPVRFRNVIYEFPQGITTTSIQPITLIAGTSATVRLMGFDLNGDTINTNDWSITDPNGGSAIFNNDSQSSGIQTVNMIYTAPANFVGQTTVVVTLRVNGLSTTNVISIIVDEPPTIALSTRNITLAEDFGTFDIGTTVTDRLVSTSLPFSVRASTDGILTITTSANNIQLSAVSDAYGTTTLTVQAMDARGQSSFANVVVVVAPVNDPPVLAVSTTALTLNEDFGTVLIATTRTDIDSNTLTLTVSESTTGVVIVTTAVSGVSVSSILNANGQTTLTITLSDGRLSTTAQVMVDVTAVNDPPVLNVSTTAVTLLEDFGTVLIATTRSDVDGDTLTLTVSESTTGVISVSTSSAGVQVVSIADANGQTTLTVTVGDGRTSVSTQVLVTVNAVNDPPVLTVSTTALTLLEDFSTTEVITATRSDVDGDPLTLTVTESTTGVVTVTTAVSGVSVSSILNATGQTTLTITLSDGRLSTTAQVLVTVNAVNNPPALTVSTTALTLVEDFATTEVIIVTKSDEDGDALTLTVSESATGVVSVSTSSTGVQVISIVDANGQTTLTITVGDGTDSVSTQVLITVNAVNDPPGLTVSTNLLLIDEDFTGPVVIRTTATDADGDALFISISSSLRLFDAVLSIPIGGVSVITNAITLTAITDLNGTTTLTVQAIDAVGTVTTEQIVVVVNAVDDPIPFTLSTSAVSLSVHDSRLDRIVNGISINNSGNQTLRAQLQVTSSGDPIFSANPTPVVSFTTNALTTLTTLTSTTPTAQLYFTIAPNRTGTATLTVHLTNLTDAGVSQQTLVVSVNSPNVPPEIVPASPSLTNLIVHGGRLYANDVSSSDIGISRFLTTARALGGHLMNINSVEEISFVYSAPNGLIFGEAWLGMVLPNRFFPGELSWMTHDSTIGYGYVTRTGVANLTIYPGHFNLTWFPDFDLGLRANRTGSTATVSNWAVHATAVDVFFLVDDGGDVPVRFRNVIYEFPQGITATSIQPITLMVDTSATVRLTGFDLNGDTINTNDWSITDPNGGSAIFNNDSQSSGVQTVNMIYTAPANFVGQTTVVVTLQVNGLSTTNAISLIVDEPPTIALSTRNITLSEDFGTFDIGTTVTDRLMNRSLPFSVLASPSGILTITTSANNIQLSAVSNANGTTTLTVQAMDTRGQSSFANVVVVVTPVNDPPVLAVSTSALTLNEDFGTVLIATTRTDIDSSTLTLTVSESTTGVVTVTTTVAGVQVTNIANVNGQTILTITVNDGTTNTSTQVVMIVTAVNDTPTLSVSTNIISTFIRFSTITINATANDIEDSTLSFSVLAFPTGVVRVTTSANTIILNAISGISGQTTITVTTIDSSNSVVTQSIAVNVINRAPVLEVSMNRVNLQEDFTDSVVIRTTATDADGDALIVSISSSSHLVDAVLSTPVNGMSIITNMITLTAITDLNGTTTLTVQAIDAGGIATTEQIVVVVNAVDDPIPFTLSTTAVSLSIHGSQLDRIVNAISISNSENKTLRAQIGVTASGDNIFSANPTPVVSFTTNALTIVTTLTSTTPTAQLYFTIVPNQTGTATLTVHLTNLDDSSTSQQTMVVSVNSPNIPPEIVAANSSITNLVVHGGHLYANDVSSSNMGISRFLSTASALGGHLMNINSVEEYSFVRSAASGLIFQEAWLGMVLPNRFFPGELSWMTHDSTIGYGYATRNGVANLTIYPGHFNLTWFPDFDLGLRANRTGNTATVSNWAVHATAVDVFFLVDDGGDFPVRFRNVIYEFPQGITAASIQPITLIAGTSATVRLMGFDLNGDTINTNDWSIADPNGGSAIFNNDSQSSGIQTVNMIYTAPANFVGQTTVVVTLQVNGLSTTNVISIIVDEPPTIALSTRNITLVEDFGTFDIGTTVTDRLVNTSLPFSVSASTDGILTITTSANNIQLSAVSNANGTTTITVQAMDARGQSSFANVVVVVTPVNDPPVLAVSTTALTLNEDFGTVLIAATRSDVDGDPLTLTVAESATGVVIVTTAVSGVSVSSILNVNDQTTLTITLSDGRLSTTAQVMVDVTAVNDPPVLTVSTTALTLAEDFASNLTIVTATDVDGDTLNITVVESSTGVVTVTTSASGVQVSSILNVNGQTTLTITANDGTTNTSTQAAMTVTAVNDTPTLSVSTNRIIVQEEFNGSVVIRTTATDIEGDAITFSVSSSTRLVNAVISVLSNDTSTVTLTAIDNETGTTTLTVHATDAGGQSGSVEFVVVVTPVNDPPTLSLSTNRIIVQEDFNGSVVIRSTATDVDGDTITLSVSSSLRLVDTTISTPINGKNTITNNIALTALADRHGTTTLTVQAIDVEGIATTEQVVVVVNAVDDPFDLSTYAITLSTVGEQINRNIQNIIINNPGNQTLRAQFQVTSSGDPIFSVNPIPMVSFTTNALTTITTLTSTTSAAQLYFTIAHNRTGTATLTVRLTNLNDSSNSQQTMVVSVNALNVPPSIVPASSSLTNLVVHGGRLYANDAMASGIGISRFLATASALGGHLVNLNSDEEYNFIRSAASRLTFTEAWLGLVLPRRTFPGELSWITHDSTIVYGIASADDQSNLTVYPGHFIIPWNVGTGLIANRYGRTTTVANWTIYAAGSGGVFFLVDDGGDGLNSDGSSVADRHVVYEFPQGITADSFQPVTLLAGTSATVRLTGFDLNGDAISTSDWSVVATTGTASISNVTQSSGVQTVDLVYTAPLGFSGHSTVVVSLQVNGLSTTTALSFVPFSPTFTLTSSSIILTENSAQTIRNQQLISNVVVSAAGTKTYDFQWRVTHSGDNIFSTNPAPVVSFTTNALVTSASVGSTAQTAQLYFTIAPDQSGRATLTVQLTNLSGGVLSQQTMVVHVNSVDVPPVIAQYSSDLVSLVVHGGRLYANDLQASRTGISRFLTTARDLGGHLINVNSVEEYTFVRTPASSGLLSHEAYFGLVLAQRLFPGELSWITHDSTIAYGYSSTNGITNHTIYPGQYLLPWATGIDNVGLQANRFGPTTTVSNWPIFAGSTVGDGVIYLVDNGGDIPARDRNVIYEFPQGLPILSNSTPINVVFNATVRLMGYDLNGDSINIPNWSGTDSNGGSVVFTPITFSTGIQSVDMVYTPAENFGGQTTVVVTLTVGGLSTTSVITFMVPPPPTIALPANAITLDEDFGTFDIATIATEQGVSASLPFSAQVLPSGIVTITTSADNIRLSAVPHANGIVTLTVRTTDSSSFRGSTQVVVTVRSVNDVPVISASTNNISTLGGFTPITIDTTATDIEEGALPFTVQASPQGVVSIRINSNAFVLSPIAGGSGRTTLTISTIDSDNATGVQTIAVNVIVIPSTTPVLRVSTNLISLQEDFGSVVIGTTATDVESGTLVVTVSSITHLVNMVISTHSITLSSVANLFGTTTLTVRARDDGGVFDSTEIVVIVASVNDTPTLTVSANMVTVVTDPVVVNVAVFDVEDTTLSFSVSGGQGSVNTVITTTSLSISRIGVSSFQVVLSLRATDTVGESVSTNITVVGIPILSVTTGIKTLNFVWGAISTATHYQLRSNPDGNSGFVDLSTTDMVVSPNSTNIRQTTAQGLVSLHRYIPRVVDPQYEVYPCNGGSCGASIGNTVVLTNAQLNSMIGRLRASNPDSEDRFGWSVDLSGDGNTLVVGAPRESGPGRGVNGFQNNSLPNSGAVYLFRRMGGAWIQQAYIKALNPSSIDEFGLRVSLNDDGNTLAVGAPYEDGSSTGVNGVDSQDGFDTGAVYVFRFNGIGWVQQAYIKASNAGINDHFGNAVALSGDGNTLAVGAGNESSSSTGVNSTQNNNAFLSGAAYLFRFDGGMWSQQAFIKASNALGGHQFGQSVSLNKDGNTLAVGAPNESNQSTEVNGNQNNPSFTTFYQSGAVYLFRFNPTSSIWSQQAYIKASNAARNAQFGFPVDLSDDGNALAVGAIGEVSSSTGVNNFIFLLTSESGAAYVFRFSTGTSTWSQQAFIKASNTGTNDGFGISVSISGDGNALVVGAIGEDDSAIGVEGNNDASTTISNSGAAYVFEFSNDRWAQQAIIKATDTSANANFGQSVSISSDGGTIAVGAWGVNTNSGAIYLY